MTRHRFTKSAALGLALIAVATPAASAQIRDETVVQSPQAATSSQIRDEAVVGASQSAPGTAQIRDETVAQTPQPSPIRDEAVIQSPRVAVARASSPSASGTDWDDVGFGAGGVLALILIGGGGAYAVAHHRRGRPESMRNLNASGADGR